MAVLRRRGAIHGSTGVWPAEILCSDGGPSAEQSADKLPMTEMNQPVEVSPVHQLLDDFEDQYVATFRCTDVGEYELECATLASIEQQILALTGDDLRDAADRLIGYLHELQILGRG